MFDTIKIFIPTHQLPTNYLNFFQDLISQSFKSINQSTGEVMYSGTIDNFKLRLTKEGLTVEGSLSKYALGTNQLTPTLPYIIKAISQLSDHLQAPLYQAIVRRVDIAENIILSQPIPFYLEAMGSINRMKLNRFEDGTGHKTAAHYLSLYDKKKECKKNKETLLSLYHDRSILRTEYRLLKHKKICELLDLKEVRVVDLLTHYSKLVIAWGQAYHRIYKNNVISTFTADIFKKKGAFDQYLRIKGIESIGGLETVLNLIKGAGKADLFGYRDGANYLSRKYKELMRQPIVTQESDLMAELDKKVALTKFVAVSDHHYQSSIKHIFNRPSLNDQ